MTMARPQVGQNRAPASISAPQEGQADGPDIVIATLA